MRALVFHGPWEMTVEDRPEPVPGPGDALLEIVATGICGSDLHGYTGENGRRHPGQVMGHETVGRVLHDRTGAHRPGKLVTVNPVIGCGGCAACAAGTPQRCPDRRVIGVGREISAAFAERMVAPARNLVPLPEGVPADIGGLVEPLAVGHHAVRRAALRPQDRVYVVGGGPIGQAVALAARRAGNPGVVVGELDPARRALLTRLGFTAIDPAGPSAAAVSSPVAPSATEDPAIPSAGGVVAALGGAADVVIDAVGSARTLQAAFEVSALGARVVLVGMAAPRVEISAYAVSTEERTVIGSFAYGEAEFRDTAAWAGAHAAELEPLIEGRVGLEQAPGTFRALADGTLKASKVLVHPSG
ncbi:zinc-dependent alcohol dehydrogenase [Sphaerisporangium sp. NPDC004334]